MKMPREIWCSINGLWYGKAPSNSIRAQMNVIRYILFTAHEEEVNGLHSQIDYHAQRAEVAEAEVERLNMTIPRLTTG